MKLLILLLPIFIFGQTKKIMIKLEFEAVKAIPFLKDTIYKCKDNTRIRFTKDSIYIYGKNQYLKLKR